MTTVVCLRHFETAVDPDVPPSEWTLSEEGEAAQAEFLERDLVDDVDAVYTSPEPKARGTAEAVADRADVLVRVDERLREVDRSGEGFIEDQSEYDEMVADYFRIPETPFDWEDRLDVQARIHRFVRDLDTDHDTVLLVSHGLFLTTMLADIFEADRFEFWQDLEFGETLEVDSETLERRWP